MPSTPKPAPPPTITLTSDFGLGHYVGAMKGAILQICPGANLVDITHGIESHDVLEGAFALACSYPHFPDGTIHLAVVDPGVGSERQGLVVSAGKHFFVGPDNGIFSLVYQKEPNRKVFAISQARYLKKSISYTFHGRDVFAPVAGWLARGTPAEEFGEEITDFHRLGPSPLKKIGPIELEGSILYIDKFGNVITDILPAEAAALAGRDDAPRFIINGRRIENHYRFYGEAPPDQLFSLVGSCGYYEISVKEGRAVDLLDAEPGNRIECRYDPSQPDEIAEHGTLRREPEKPAEEEN